MFILDGLSSVVALPIETFFIKGIAVKPNINSGQ